MTRPAKPSSISRTAHEVRIIGGQWKRTKLAVPDKPGLRPTPDRVRETLFNWLGQDLAGWRCVDAFAGTGALGLEAASRGAAEVLLIEQDPELVAQLRAVQARLGASTVKIERANGLAVLGRLAGASLDLILLDPPFDADIFGKALGAASAALGPQGLIYLEAPAAWSDEALSRHGLAVRRHLKAGAVHAHLLGAGGAEKGASAATGHNAAQQAAITGRSRTSTMASNVIAVYPGTFDPMTLGHEDVVRRATQLFDRVIVAVAAGHHKKSMFTLAERIEMAREVAKAYPQVEVESFSGLLRDFVVARGAKAMVRGLRAVTDFDYEFQLAGMNRSLMPDVETVFLTPSDKYQFISSTFVREIAILGGEVDKFVSPSVQKQLVEKVRALGND